MGRYFEENTYFFYNNVQALSAYLYVDAFFFSSTDTSWFMLPSEAGLHLLFMFIIAQAFCYSRQ